MFISTNVIICSFLQMFSFVYFHKCYSFLQVHPYKCCSCVHFSKWCYMFIFSNVVIICSPLQMLSYLHFYKCYHFFIFANVAVIHSSKKCILCLFLQMLLACVNFLNALLSSVPSPTTLLYRGTSIIKQITK